MKLKMITDERLKVKNMENIRVAYMMQMLGFIGILGYNFIIDGLSGLRENPLWMLLVLSTIILFFTSMKADERIELKNLQIIRVAFAVQVIGIIIILGSDIFTYGMSGMKENPLWFIFSVSIGILAFLSISVSTDHEENKKPTKSGLIISLIIVTLISITIGIYTSFNEGYTAFESILIGTIFLAVGIVPFLYVYKLSRGNVED